MRLARFSLCLSHKIASANCFFLLRCFDLFSALRSNDRLRHTILRSVSLSVSFFILGGVDVSHAGRFAFIYFYLFAVSVLFSFSERFDRVLSNVTELSGAAGASLRKQNIAIHPENEWCRRSRRYRAQTRAHEGTYLRIYLHSSDQKSKRILR